LLGGAASFKVRSEGRAMAQQPEWKAWLDGGWKAWRDELEEVVKSDTFMVEWLAESEAYKTKFETQMSSTSLDERDTIASKDGFRTWRNYTTCRDHQHKLLEMFVHEAAFRTLWRELRESDANLGSGPELYGPHNGSVPSRLIRAVELWHQEPKLTKADRAKHNRRIASLCDDLLQLLNQVTPSGALDQFAKLNVNSQQAETILECFESPRQRREKFGAHPRFVAGSVSEMLARIGLTPTWAVGNIAASARRSAYAVLPPKVRTPTAFRTFVIRALSDALDDFRVLPGRAHVADDLLADVVSLVAGMHCSVDDLRKAIKQRAAEKTRRRKAGMVHCESRE
jgi:hypothetical protein